MIGIDALCMLDTCPSANPLELDFSPTQAKVTDHANPKWSDTQMLSFA